MKPCAPSVWVDGALVRPVGEPPPTSALNPRSFRSLMASVRDVAEMECHASAAGLPGESSGANALCGVLVVWAKR